MSEEIKDPKTGEVLAEVAENEDEAFWNKIVKAKEFEIGQIKEALKFNESILEMAKEKLENATE